MNCRAAEPTAVSSVREQRSMQIKFALLSLFSKSSWSARKAEGLEKDPLEKMLSDLQDMKGRCKIPVIIKKKPGGLLCRSLKQGNLVLGSKRGKQKQKNQPVLGVQAVNSLQSALWVARDLSGAETVGWVCAAPFWLHR